MELPQHDLDDRLPVWDAMQMLFADIDPADEIDNIARVCACSKYSLAELEIILYDEVFPACRFNYYSLPAPVWHGFDINWLTPRILEKQRHGKRRLWLSRRTVDSEWARIKPRIEALRQISRSALESVSTPSNSGS